MSNSWKYEVATSLRQLDKLNKLVTAIVADLTADEVANRTIEKFSLELSNFKDREGLFNLDEVKALKIVDFFLRCWVEVISDCSSN